MLKKICFFCLALYFGQYGMAQKQVNDYKYIIIPNKFEFQTETNQYQLNALTEFLFNKYGYTAYMVGKDLPEDLKKEGCLALTSEVSKETGGMFKTKLEIILKDCYGKVVMTSQIGQSRLKEYDKAYTMALRQAFETFQNLDYAYELKETVIEVAKEDSNSEKAAEVTKEALSAVLITTLEKETVKEVEAISKKPDNEGLYYAQATSNGYQIVDSQPKIVMLLLATAAENVFIVKDKNAIVFKEDGFWFYSENDGKLREKIAMNIKF